MLIDLSEAVEFLKGCEDAVILTHQSPDGDCIGAGFALKDLLEALGKRSRVLCSDEFPKRYDFMTSVGSGEEFEPKTVIAVDIADPQLMGNLRETYGNKVQLCIDHHISNVGYAEKTLLNAGASATCELIYELADAMKIQMSDHCAACIYTGIATDTGCFKYECTTARCHEIAAELMKSHKLKYAKINREMFDVKSIGRLKMERIVTDLMEYYLDNRLTMICITSDILNEQHVDANDLDGNSVDSSLFANNAFTVVNFWFSGCKPCVDEMDDLDALNQRIKEQGGEVIGVNTETLDGNADNIATAKKILESAGASFRNIYFDPDSEAGKFALGIMAFPTTCVVDRQGNIVGEPIMGGIDQEANMATLEKLIADAVASDTGK